MLPALALGLLLPACSRILGLYRPAEHAWIAHAAIVSIVGVVVLGAGLALWGRDGRMATYGALVAACATAQWCLVRGWRR